MERQRQRQRQRQRAQGTGPLGWLRAVGELVLPRTCVACGTDGTWWCEQCAVALSGRPFPCEAGWVGELEQVGELDGLGADRHAVVCHAVAPYRGAAGLALVALKERGVDALVPALAEALAGSIRASVEVVQTEGSPRLVAIVPAPSRPAAVRRRGSDVLAVLARAAADRLRSPELEAVVVPCLHHVRPVADQAGLDARARARNLAGALRVRPGAVPLLRNRTVVVVDDVLTTGATITEAVRAVAAAVPGAAPVAATVASAGVAPHGGSRPVAAPPGADSAERLVAAGRDG